MKLPREAVGPVEPSDVDPAGPETLRRPPRTGRSLALLFVFLSLVAAGAILAWRIQTDGGRVKVRDLRFVGTGGTLMSALLFVPPEATPEHPAPAVLAVHGYINSRETQSGFAIELARRGYVVLELDQTGHGFSDPPAFANGFGGPDGLRYLRSLDFVDTANVGLEGHSMGGWAVVSAAAAEPDGYRSMALVGSSTGSFGTKEGTADFPRNLGLVYSLWDEFSQTMWGTRVPADVVDGPKLKKQFGTTGRVEVGHLYGDPAEGTARLLYQPHTTHPGDHLSRAAIGDVVDWMGQTLDGGRPIPSGNQIWYWKSAGTLLALLALVACVFPLGALLLDTRFFSELGGRPPRAVGATGAGWWMAAAVAVAVPVLTYFPLQNLGSAKIPPNAFWPQSVTTGIVVWALGNAVLTLVLFGLWHRVVNRKRGVGAVEYGLAWDDGALGRRVMKSALLALALVAFCYGVLATCSWLFHVDFRFWVVALKPMTPLQLRIALCYLPAFLAFFLVLGVALHGQLRREGGGRRSGEDGGIAGRGGGAGSGTLARPMVRNAALLAGGFVALLLVQYGPFLTGHPLPLGQPLLTIVAFQFVPLLAMVGLVSTWFYRKTGHVYVGVLFNSFFVTWYVVAGQATHFAFH